MEQSLIQFLKVHNVKYVQITNPDTLVKIYNLFINDDINICDWDMTDGTLLFYYGLYYCIKSDTTKMVEHYLKAIDCGNDSAMNRYANWCEENNMHTDAQKYYLMAIDHGSKAAIFNYALWCEEHDTEENTRKYYLMAIEYGKIDAMNNYASWCEEHGSEEDVQKYYLMAINHDNVFAMYNYARWCEEHSTKDNVQKYYLMAIEHNDVEAMHNYAKWCEKKGTRENIVKYYLLAIKYDYAPSMYNYAMWLYDQHDPEYKKYFILGCVHNHSACQEFINNKFTSKFMDKINEVYDYLTDDNKKIANEIIISTHQITNINIMNESLCLVCQTHTKCLFLPCGHPQCMKCWGAECSLCNH